MAFSAQIALLEH